MRIFSSAESCRRVARRRSFTTPSAGCFAGPGFCFIFAPRGYDEPEILRSWTTQSVSRALTAYTLRGTCGRLDPCRRAGTARRGTPAAPHPSPRPSSPSAWSALLKPTTHKVTDLLIWESLGSHPERIRPQGLGERLNRVIKAIASPEPFPRSRRPLGSCYPVASASGSAGTSSLHAVSPHHDDKGSGIRSSAREVGRAAAD